MKSYLIDSFFSTLLVFITLLMIPMFLDFDLLRPFKNAFSDFQITDYTYSNIRESEAIDADTNIVVLDIGLLSRADIAKLIMKVNESSPRLIAVDVIFNESDNRLEDLFLSNAFNEVDNLVLASKLVDCNYKGICKKLIQSDSIFTRNAVTGFTNKLFESDKRYSTVREFKPYLRFDGKEIKSFSVQAARMFNPKLENDLLERGNENEIINYKGPFNKFFFPTSQQIFNADFSTGLLRNKTWFLGYIGEKQFREFENFENLYYTPLNEQSGGRSFPDMSSLLIHVNAFSMICDGTYKNQTPQWISYLIAFLLCSFNMIIFAWISEKNRKWFEIGSLIIFVIESLILLFATVLIYERMSLQLKLTEALFAVALSVFVYQIYNDSLKQIFIRIIHKLRN